MNKLAKLTCTIRYSWRFHWLTIRKKNRTMGVRKLKISCLNGIFQGFCTSTVNKLLQQLYSLCLVLVHSATPITDSTSVPHQNNPFPRDVCAYCISMCSTCLCVFSWHQYQTFGTGMQLLWIWCRCWYTSHSNEKGNISIKILTWILKMSIWQRAFIYVVVSVDMCAEFMSLNFRTLHAGNTGRKVWK